jgi:hypothetical protein
VEPEDPSTVLLHKLAAHLWAEAEEHVPRVLGGMEPDTDNIYVRLIRAQGVSDPGLYHLPEPILHPVSDPVVLVVGMNPGYSNSETMPTLNDGFKHYVDWYKTRFDEFGRLRRGQAASTRHPDSSKRGRSHYAEVERVLEASERLGVRPLGRTAVYADANPWKYKKANHGPSISDVKMRDMIDSRLKLIVEALRPPIILALGDALWTLFGSPNARLKTFGQTRIGQHEALVVPMYHPSYANINIPKEIFGERPVIGHRQSIGLIIQEIMDRQGIGSRREEDSD